MLPMRQESTRTKRLRNSVSKRPSGSRRREPQRRYKIFRDPIHDHIGFEGAEIDLLRLVDSRAFQRLRRIHQNGAAFLAYHGLERSRFSHGLGTYEAARRFSSALARAAASKKTAMGPFAPNETALMGFKAACLVHDIGHPCFSHAGERFFQRLVPSQRSQEVHHESWTARIVEEDDELRRVLSRMSWAEDLKAFIRGPLPHPLAYLQRFLSGSLDVDRLDYLLRDSQACGVGYGSTDFSWLMQTMNVELVGMGWEDPHWEIVFDGPKAGYAIEQFLLARRSMYSQVYFHKTARASEALLLALLLRARRVERYIGGSGSQRTTKLPAAFGTLAKGMRTSVDDYLALDDFVVLSCAVDWASRERDPVLRDLADRLIRRRLFKAIPLPEEKKGILRDDEAIAALRELVDRQPDLPKLPHSFGDRLSDYYLATDENRVELYDSALGSIWVRHTDPGGKARIVPFEADPRRLGLKFLKGAPDSFMSVSFVIVPEECEKEVRQLLARWNEP